MLVRRISPKRVSRNSDNASESDTASCKPALAGPSMTMMKEEMAETIAVILCDLDSSGCSKAT